MFDTGTIGMNGAIATIIGVSIIAGTSDFACGCGTDISYSARFATAAGTAGNQTFRDMHEGGGKSAALVFYASAATFGRPKAASISRRNFTAASLGS